MIVAHHPDRRAAPVAPLRPARSLTPSCNRGIPAAVLALPRPGAINGHHALRPRTRGTNATGWALRTGDPAHGLTFHAMPPRRDDGPIRARRAIPLTDDAIDTRWPRLAARRPAAPGEALGRRAAGAPGTPQRAADATDIPRFAAARRSLAWAGSARDTPLQARRWAGTRDAPRGALGTIAGGRTRVLTTRLVDEPGTGAAPGTVLRRDGEALLIQCGDRPLAILRHQPEPAGEASPAAAGLIESVGETS